MLRLEQEIAANRQRGSPGLDLGHGVVERDRNRRHRRQRGTARGAAPGLGFEGVIAGRLERHVVGVSQRRVGADKRAGIVIADTECDRGADADAFAVAAVAVFVADLLVGYGPGYDLDCVAGAQSQRRITQIDA